MLLLEQSLGNCNITLITVISLYFSTHSFLLISLSISTIFYAAMYSLLRLPDTLAAASKIVELLKTVPPCRNNEGLKPVCE